MVCVVNITESDRKEFFFSAIEQNIFACRKKRWYHKRRKDRMRRNCLKRRNRKPRNSPFRIMIWGGPFSKEKSVDNNPMRVESSIFKAVWLEFFKCHLHETSKHFVIALWP